MQAPEFHVLDEAIRIRTESGVVALTSIWMLIEHMRALPKGARMRMARRARRIRDAQDAVSFAGAFATAARDAGILVSLEEHGMGVHRERLAQQRGGGRGAAVSVAA